ncbi:MAG: SlyX family protein [Aureliella sp.]
MSDAQQPSSQAERIVELEICLTHQQRLLEQLDDVVTEQESRIRKLEQRLETMKTEQQQLRDRVSEQSATIPDEKPPHY